MALRAIPQRSRIRTFRFWATVSVVLLVTATVATAIIAKVERDDVSSRQDTLRTVLRPARTAEADLLTAYVNQETGQRGFLLTGDERFLQPYTTGRATAARLQDELTTLIGQDAQARPSLLAAVNAGRAWQQQSAEPEIAARRQGPIPQGPLLSIVARGKVLFDALRARFDDLITRTEAEITAALGKVSQTQRDAGTAIDAALVGAIALAVVALFGLRYLFAVPLTRFLRQIRVVASGDYAAPLDAGGPQEFTIIADAVDRMRASIIRSTADAAAVQQRLRLREERDRLAADLHDRTIQRVFGLGLALDSINTKASDGSKDLEPLVEETDKIIRELRSVILAISGDPNTEGLRAGVMALVSDSRRSLGFLPELEVRGPIDTAVPADVAAEVLAVLREALSNAARHARASQVLVTLGYEDEQLMLRVADDGVGVAPDARAGDGTRNVRARAERLGGTASVCPGPNGGTVVSWQVPLPADRGALHT
jgi:signal transduction histidine kinase